VTVTSCRKVCRTFAGTLLMSLAAILFLAVYSSTAFADKRKDIPEVLKVGFSSRVFAETDTRDARVAMELWARELSKSMGLETTPKTLIFSDVKDLRSALTRGELTIITLSAVEYLSIRDSVKLRPIIVASNNRGRERDQLLLVRKASDISSIQGLRNKTISLLPPGKHESSHIWLDVLLLRGGIRQAAGYFRKIQESATASQAIMSLFFGKVDAAIVSRGAFETAKTLNPQLGRRLTVMVESKSLIGDLTCIPSSISNTLGQTIENAALDLHKTTTGRQIFTLFQIDRVIPFQPSYLEGLEELLLERDKLIAKRAKKQ
jgi:ABC-type phosphate/phosphonate transport system substrate-binding protein